MKVYLVFKYDAIMDTGDEVVKVYTDEEKARTFINHMNNTTRYQWYHQEIEVEG